MKNRVLLVSFLAVTLVGPLAAQQVPHGQDRPPGPALSPEEAVRKMTVPEGFTVEVVAAEPEIVNPVAMTFDERGRIWVTESFEYPRPEPGPGRDRVKILEDTDRDGRVDQVSVFMEGLNIPSGIAVGHGGVWIANAPDILFVQDTDGDGKADRQEVVVTGFGRTDTHELPNSLTWGPDGWLYGLNGIFNRSHVTYPKDSPRANDKPEGWTFTAAMFRIHPRTREFQLFAEGTSNPWGIAFNNEGSAFVSACVIDHLWHIVETGYYHRQAGAYPPYTWKIESIVRHKHQKAAYCGLHFFDSDAYPEPFREKLYMGNIHGNCVNVDRLRRDGSTYFATGEPDFLSANDAWFMPVAQKTGPDGCLYVLDWYDQYHCYQDARRDPAGIERGKGRLYRVRYKETPRAPRFDLAKESDEQLIERLKSPNVYFRDLAQRILAERNAPAAVPLLLRLVADSKAPRKGRLHALYALAGMDGTAQRLVQALGIQDDETLRAWGVRIAFNDPLLRAGIDLAQQLPFMPGGPEVVSPEVRLQSVIGLSKLTPSRDVLRRLLGILEVSADDPLIPRIVWRNLHPLLEERGDEFLELLVAERRVGAPGVSAILPRIAERIMGRKQATGHSIATLLQMLDSRDAAAARACLEQLASRLQTGEIAGKQITEIRESLAPVLAPWLASGAEHPLSFDAAIVAASWKDAAALESIRRIVSTADAPAETRLKALGALVALSDESLRELLPTILASPADAGAGSAGGNAGFQSQVLGALGRGNDPRVADVILAAYKTLPPEVQSAAIDTLTQRALWARPLLTAIARKEIPADALSVNQVRKLLASRDAELADAVRKQWGTIREARNPKRDAVVAQMRGFLRRTPGDAHRGQEVFSRVCGECHRIYGKGADVGPDITLNGRNSYEQLLSNVFDPSLVIGAAYQARTIVTTRGRVVTGLVAEESDQRIVLKVQGGKQEVIAANEIDEMKVSELSLMPEDLEKTLKPPEIADLFAFITLDKPPDDPAAKRLAGMRDILPRSATDPAQFDAILAEVAPGFSVSAVGEGGLALLREHYGRFGVVRTHPLEKNVPCVLARTVDLPAGKKSKLLLSVSHDPRGDWELIVRANGKTLFDGEIDEQSTEKYWADLEIDLSRFAGEQVKLELDNHPDEWQFEAAYWGRVEVVTE
jgi:putative membrane-bound dehydrogenase-like protein